MSVIHRYGMNGGAQCGADPDKFGHLKLSISGVVVTCPACIGPSKEQIRETQLAALRAAINNQKGDDGSHGLNDIDPNDPCYGADPS